MSLHVFKGMKALAIGAHPDDIEIGAGGFVHRLISDFGCVVDFLILTRGLRLPNGAFTEERKREAEASAKMLGVRNVGVADFKDCELHSLGHELIHILESALENGVGRSLDGGITGKTSRYDMILTHAFGDTHRDHSEVHAATRSAARRFPGWILLYQAPSTVPNEFRPTMFVELSEANFQAKRAALSEHKSQQDKPFLKAKHLETIAESWAYLHRFEDGRFEAFEIYRSFVLLPKPGC